MLANNTRIFSERTKVKTLGFVQLDYKLKRQKLKQVLPNESQQKTTELTENNSLDHWRA